MPAASIRFEQEQCAQQGSWLCVYAHVQPMIDQGSKHVGETLVFKLVQV